MALTTEDVLNSINRAPVGTKAGVLVVLFALISGLNFFLLIQPTMDTIAQRQQERVRLEDDLIQKQTIANDLAKFRREKEVLERKLQQALTELPNEANVDELMRSLSEIGTKSGLTITQIDPMGEQKKSFYAEIPLVMQVTGNYHEIGVFLDAVSKLARIVNVAQLRLSGPVLKNEKLTVQANYVATTFRFLPEGGK